MNLKEEAKIKDNAALGRLYEDYHQELTAFLKFRFDLDSDTADDIVQDTFLSLSKYLSPGSKIENEKSLIFKIAKNKFADLCRKDAAAPFVPDTDAKGVEDFIDTPSQERVFFGQDTLDQLENAILTLPPKCQKVFVLRAIGQLSHKEISEKCGISISMVEKHLRKAFKLIKKRVDLDG